MGEFTFDPAAPLEDALIVKIPERVGDTVVEHRFEVKGLTRQGGDRITKLQRQAAAAQKKAEGNGGVMVDAQIDREAKNFITAISVMLRPTEPNGESAAELLTKLWADDTLDMPLVKLHELLTTVARGANPDPPA